MKKYIFLVLLSTMFFSGCLSSSPFTGSKNKNISGVSKETKNLNKGKSSISDYYPFVQNREFIYKGIGNEYADMNIYTDYIEKNKIQIRQENGGTTVGQVIENRNGELRLLYSRAEFYHREKLIGKVNLKPEVLLKEPLVKGTSWKLANGDKRYISNINSIIKTAAGSFKCIEVTTEGASGKQIDYYGFNTGLIKSAFITNGTEISSTLSRVINNSGFQQRLQIFYPDFEKNINIYVYKAIKLKTNEDIKTYFERGFKTSPRKDITRVLGEKTKIKSLSLNEENNVVHVDFSKDLVPEMNAGTSLEGMILTCITNTFGAYYNTDKVYITIDGEPYSSGHILMKENELFYVNYKNTKELK